MWISYLAYRIPHGRESVKQLKYSTIKHYVGNLSGVHNCLGFDTHNNPCNHTLVKRALKGMKRYFFLHEPERLCKRVRKELTPDLLALLGPLIPNKCRDVRQASLWAVLNCGVWGLLRPGELTIRSEKQATRLKKKLLCEGLIWVMKPIYSRQLLQESEWVRRRRDGKWEIHEHEMIYDQWSIQQVDMVYLLLSNTKTQQFESKILARIMTGEGIEALWSYLSLRNKICPTLKHDYLFVSEWGMKWNSELQRREVVQEPFKYKDLLASMQELVSGIGLDPREYTGHSLRRGGATALANARVDKGIIKELGRWKSDASVDIYTNIDEELLKRAMQLISGMDLSPGELRQNNLSNEQLEDALEVEMDELEDDYESSSSDTDSSLSGELSDDED